MTPNLHEPQWLERALTAGALYLATLTSSLVKKSLLQRRLGKLEEKVEDFTESIQGFVTGVYRRLGRLESHANITPNPFGTSGPDEPTKPNVRLP